MTYKDRHRISKWSLAYYSTLTRKATRWKRRAARGHERAAQKRHVARHVREETGEANGCLILVLVVLALLLFGCIKIATSGGGDDCYTTGDPGSAQYNRDVGHCIEGDR